MDKQLKLDIREFWDKQQNTKAELAVFGASLNPPVVLSIDDTTQAMVNDLFQHCGQEKIEMAFDEDAGEFVQKTTIVPVDGDGGVETVSGEVPTGERSGIPGPEEEQEQPAQDVPYDLGHPDPGLVGAGAPTPPEHPGPEPETFDDLESVFDRMEEVMALPPAHQNAISALQRKAHGKFSELLGEARRLIS